VGWRTLEGNFFVKMRTQLAEVSENERKMQRVFPPVSWALVCCVTREVHPHRLRKTCRMPVLLCCRANVAQPVDPGLKPRAHKVPQMGLDGSNVGTESDSSFSCFTLLSHEHVLNAALISKKSLWHI
jgi:hypothetical protein